MERDEARSARIRALNDQLRCKAQGGRIILTQGIAALGLWPALRIITAVAAFDAFGPDNDPHGEHDFAAMEIDGISVLWKIDYYDTDYRYHSPDPADPEGTARVLTIMLSHEW